MLYFRTANDAILAVCPKCSHELKDKDWSFWEEGTPVPREEGETVPMCCACGHPLA